MNRKKARLSAFAAGVLSVVLAIAVFCMPSGGYENYEYYGGDAYTGIQQAAAQTSNNVRSQTGLLRLGFGSVLLVAGLGFLGAAWSIEVPGERKEKKETLSPEPDNKITDNRSGEE